MKAKISYIIIVLMSISTVYAEDPVHFDDPKLKEYVEWALGKTNPTSCDMLLLTHLHNRIDLGISDLTGLEYATNMIVLQLEGSNLNSSDLSIICQYMPDLEDLDVSRNQISNVSCVFINNTKLENLDIGGNNIISISGIGSLTDLRTFTAANNNIEDICPLTNLYNLERVTFTGNSLNCQSHTLCIPQIQTNNPGIDLQYDPPYPPCDISVRTDSPKNITNSCATLQGYLISDGRESCDCRFVYWKEGEGTNRMYTNWQEGKRSGQTFSESLCNLEPCTIYYYAAEARNSAGSSTVSTMSFTTPARVSVSSSVGGSVAMPGEGNHEQECGTAGLIEALPKDNFIFSHWSGSAVDEGCVDDPHANPANLTYCGDHTLRAQFLSLLEAVYVDANMDDPNEDGNDIHPFDSIQEAVEVAQDGTTIFVGPGTYIGTIDFMGRDIVVTSEDPDNPRFLNFAVIDANDTGTAVTFNQEETDATILKGFIITRGLGQRAGAILCQNSNPIIQNCLIVGNRSLDAHGGALVWIDANGVIENCTIAHNYGGQNGAGIVLENSSPVITNCIVWDNLAMDLAADATSGPVISYTNMTTLQAGEGNLVDDPEFYMIGYWGDLHDPSIAVAPNHPNALWIPGDYHLMSEAGRWDMDIQSWAQDAVSSPCIDAGDPNAPWAGEYESNGGRINMGAYGNTQQASLSNK